MNNWRVAWEDYLILAVIPRNKLINLHLWRYEKAVSHKLNYACLVVIKDDAQSINHHFGQAFVWEPFEHIYHNLKAPWTLLLNRDCQCCFPISIRRQNLQWQRLLCLSQYLMILGIFIQLIDNPHYLRPMCIVMEQRSPCKAIIQII